MSAPDSSQLLPHHSRPPVTHVDAVVLEAA